MYELFRKIRGLLNKDGIVPVYVAPRPGDVRHSLADISEARALLGFKPNYCIETGLKKALEWYYTNL